MLCVALERTNLILYRHILLFNNILILDITNIKGLDFIYILISVFDKKYSALKEMIN